MFSAIDIETSILARFLGWVADQRGLAAALEAADGVGAGGARTADVRRLDALVDVDAEGSGGLKPGPASTGPVLTTLGVVGTVKVGLAAGSHFGREAARTTIAFVTGRTFADISGNPVYTFGSRTTLVQGPRGAFIDI